uniref:Calmodulin-binding transcription activator 1 n=1 Tax=Camelus bactrianus TaxID=9837 RepID=A0A9W3HJT7_CAMBA|nr:calmodulin-binding transcription activator 1 isoform X4 [Camelus bactrianus]
MVDSPVVTGVSSMAVASVMGSLSQSATVFMSEVTNEAVYTMSPTTGPNPHLLSPDASQSLVLAVSSDGHKFAFPTSGSSESLAMLPTNVSEELVLSTTLDGGRKIPETTMNFDPDCFLNNPKQGQTYGGGGLKAEMVSTNVRHSPPVERGFSFATVLTKEIKTEDTSFEQQMAKDAYSSSAAAAASSSLTLTAGSSLLPSGGGLSPSTTLEQMDFSAIDSNKDYTSSFSQTGRSPHVHQTPSPSFFLQDASKPLPIEQNAHSSLSDPGGTFVMPTVKTEASSQTSSCSGHVETRIESTSSLHLMQFQANFQAMAAEGEVTMETSQVAEGGEGLIKSGELQACSSEHYLQPEPTGVIRSASGVPILPGNVVQGLYPVAQPGLGNASNMELSLDHFDISFSNQFSDLINDFISVEGGSGTIYGHQLVSGDSAALSQSEDGARAPFTQAEMCIPCCSPQQGSLQLSSAEAGASTMAYMHVAEVVSAASGPGTLGMLQQSGRVFMVTDYSPEWSYPEGGVKVLITGPWQEASNNYSCLFDQISVPASLIQPGVLRCYCPAHDTGLVTLQVAFNNQIISNSVVFEYKARALPTLPSSQHDWLSLDDNQFRMSILERLEQMERRMAEMTGSQQHKQGSGGGSSGGGAGSGNGGSQAQCASSPGTLGSCFESRVVVVCEKMMSRACWAKSKHLIHSKTFRGMTLLHLAAAQGYATLIQTLIKWRTKHADSIDLELEVDPLNVDHFSCTPLMWACALGHLEAAVVLYKWDRRAISIPDSLGRLPLGIARSRGHVKLAECLEHLQRDEQAQLGQNPRIHCPPSEEPGTESWMTQWHSEAISSPEIPKGVTVIASTNPVQVTGNPKGTSVGKETALSQVRPREPMSVLMMANREVVNTELGSFRDSAESEECSQSMDDIQVNMMTLAEHIIEATPDRIKQENFVPMESPALERTDAATISSTMSWLAGYLADVDHLPNAAQIRSTYNEPLTPSSNTSLSPVGSPVSEIAFEKPSLPSAADWSEFLSASSSEKVENEFAQLTLSDHEQRELYEAARLVQTAFRKYKGRPLREQQEVAAAVIQRCYRKYKQYALYKKMTQAAILIQSKFRSYYEQKKFQQSRRAAVLIQKYYRSYKKCGKRRQARRTAVIVQQKLRSSLLTKKQDQAARKIMRFLRRCRHRVKELRKAKELEDIQQHPLAM